MNTEKIQPKKVAIIGGGIAGMAAAYQLQETACASGSQVSYTLFESAPRLGGKIQTDITDGLVVEGGPDSFLAQKPWAAQLALALGLEDELEGANPAHKKLFVVNRGRLTPMPDGVMLIIPTRFMPFVTSPLISWPGKIRMGMDFLIPARTDDEDESLGDFIRRRLGTEALEKIAEPLMGGIHVSDPEQQSILGTFPRFRAMEKKHGSLIRAMLAQRKAARASGNNHSPAGQPGWKSSVFITLRGGMQRLVDVLADALTGEVRTGCPVTRLQALPGGGYRVTAGGQPGDFDAVILATPAFTAAGLVDGFAHELSCALQKIRYVSTATVSLAFRRSEIPSLVDGIGFIVPRREKRKVTACTVTSVKFAHRAPEDILLLRCFVGGPGHEETLEVSDEGIIANARAEMADLLGIRAEPVFARVYRWDMGNAQYDVGHLERVKEMMALSAAHPGLFLTGSAYEGVGIPDCVRQGQQSAEKALAFLRAG